MKNLHLEAIFHEPKSRFAYAFDNKTLHIRIQTKKDAIDSIKLIYNDPFIWANEEGTYTWQTLEKPMTKLYQTDLHDFWHVEVSTDRDRFKYAFLLEDKIVWGCNYHKKADGTYNHFNFFSFPYISEADVLKQPSWLQDTIWYHIFPDRFYTDNQLVDWKTAEVRNDTMFGGDLKGITSKLDYLKELGISGIYLNPIFESPSAHKYDTKDYLKVDETFGTNDDLKQLVKTAHQKGIKIMIDAVFNHCGWEHPIFQDVVKNGEKSEYYDWFIEIEKPFINFDIKNGQPVKTEVLPNYHTFAHTKFMPKWNTSNPKTQEYLIGITKKWIEMFDIDAIRYDVADEVSHDFWNKLATEVHTIKPDFYQIGETFHNGNPWLTTNQFNGIMNYKLMFSIEDYLNDKINSEEFSFRINKVLTLYPQNAIQNMFNLIDSHDTVRAINKFKDRFHIALLLMILFPGRPSIYYGTEVDLAGGEDPDNRRPYPWGTEQGETYKLLKELFNLKRKHNPQTIEWLYHQDALIYKADELYVVVSKENETIKLPYEMNGTFIDVLTNEELELRDILHLSKNEYHILKKVD